MTPHGQSFIAGQRLAGTGSSFQVVSPLDRSVLPGEFLTAGEDQVDAALLAAADAHAAFAASEGQTRAAFLEAIADKILALGDALIERAMLESGLPKARLEGERGRTVGQLRLFAQLAANHSWVEARIDPADPARQPLPKPDLRRLMVPIGPVVVFGASNFPLAFSVAGGDTASALATGNPVVVKAHEAHPGTSELVAEAITAAVKKVGLPAGVFSMVQGSGKVLGPWLAKHPATKAIGFTGSEAAGRALFDLAASRPDPIPVFAEMGSLNPVVILSEALASRGAAIGTALAQSITLGAGQFCTKPGLFFTTDGEGLDAFREALASTISGIIPSTMLHPGIADHFNSKCGAIKSHSGIKLLATTTTEADPNATQGQPLVLEITAAQFISDDTFRHEVFGPFAILVVAKDSTERDTAIAKLGGQLTATIYGDEAELSSAQPLVASLGGIAGRVIFNGVPTGVEVFHAMQHGGPYPASTDSRFTSVGTAALFRFVRPVSYQNAPQGLLPPALQDTNPLGIIRLVNGQPSADPLS
jgi:2,5-dioxopentanoate dehydrogenase